MYEVELLLKEEEKIHRRILMIRCNISSSRFRKDSLSNSVQILSQLKPYLFFQVLCDKLGVHESGYRSASQPALLPVFGLKPTEKAKDTDGQGRSPWDFLMSDSPLRK